MFKNGFKYKTIECNNDSFSKIPLRSHLPRNPQSLIPQAPKEIS